MEALRESSMPSEDHLLTGHVCNGGMKDKMYHATHGVTDKVSMMRTSIIDDLRSHPTKWAGIAAGAGFGLGIVGRILRHRMNARPHIVVIEAC